MTSSTFLPIPARPGALDLGSAAWLFGLSLAAFASLLPLRLLEQRGVVGIHWIHCAVIVALTTLVAAITIGILRQWPRHKPEPVYIPQGAEWPPSFTARSIVVQSKPDAVTAGEDPDQSADMTRVATARATGVALGRLRIQHELRDPLHHARMIVRDLEAIGGPPDRLEYVRSLRLNIDEISSAVADGDVRASFAARFDVRSCGPASEKAAASLGNCSYGV